jgi:hypothetical protein
MVMTAPSCGLDICFRESKAIEGALDMVRIDECAMIRYFLKL